MINAGHKDTARAGSKPCHVSCIAISTFLAAMLLLLFTGCQREQSKTQRIGVLPTLWAESDTKPATLKDNDYHCVSGDYAYVDLEAVLKLIGRLSRGGIQVSNIRFFERVAASVMVGERGGKEYLCTKDEDGAWHIVGMRMWSH